MALVALAHGPVAVINHLHRATEQLRRERRPRADDGRRVVLAAEAAAHRRADDFDFRKRHAQTRRHKPPRAERMLHAAVNFDHGVRRARHANRRLGFHVSVLDGLRLKLFLDDEIGLLETFVNIAAPDDVGVDDV